VIVPCFIWAAVQNILFILDRERKGLKNAGLRYIKFKFPVCGLLGRYQLKQKIRYVLEGNALQFFEADRNNKINGLSMKYQKKDK